MVEIHEFQELDKFGTVQKRWLSGILQWKIFWKKEELKVTKMKTKFSTFYEKYLQIASFDQKNFNHIFIYNHILI